MPVSNDRPAYLALSNTLRMNIATSAHTALSGPDIAAVTAIAEELATMNVDPVGALISIWDDPRHMTGVTRNYVEPGAIVGGA